MIIHRSDSRGHANHGWLQSFHTFSFASYMNPQRMGFGALRVINDDTVEASRGFDTHGHKDMEIITIPLEGKLRHDDSQGNSRFIQKGEVQVMSAGTGILHSEFNASDSEAVKLLQIWVHPSKNDLSPRYDQKSFSLEGRKNSWQLIVSSDGRDGSLMIHQNAFFSLIQMQESFTTSYQKKSPQNGVYVFVISGEVLLNDELFLARDGVGLTEDEEVSLVCRQDSEVLVMEVPLS